MNQKIIERLKSFAPEAIEGVDEYRGDLTVTVKKQEIARIAAFLKNDPELAFDLLVDLLGVDMYRPEGRFEVVYNLFSIANHHYVRLKVLVEESDPVVPTLTGLWRAADWHERETYDMFGIQFAGHPDLRRLYMPEEFEYYPLRKDFPLMGIPDSLTLPRR